TRFSRDWSSDVCSSDLGQGISSLNYGEIWHFFEQQLGYPVTSIGTDYFDQVNLEKLDVLILPSGSYSRILDEAGLKKLTSWVREIGRASCRERGRIRRD